MLAVAHAQHQPQFDSAKVSKSALRTFFNIANAWGLNADEAMTAYSGESCHPVHGNAAT